MPRALRIGQRTQEGWEPISLESPPVREKVCAPGPDNLTVQPLTAVCLRLMIEWLLPQ